MRESTRITAALLTYVAWTIRTLFGMRWASDGAKKPLIQSVAAFRLLQWG